MAGLLHFARDVTKNTIYQGTDPVRLMNYLSIDDEDADSMMAQCGDPVGMDDIEVCQQQTVETCRGDPGFCDCSGCQEIMSRTIFGRRRSQEEVQHEVAQPASRCTAKKRKEAKQPSGSGKKKRVIDPVEDERRNAISNIIAVMHREKKSCKEAVLLYANELSEEYAYNYLDMIKNDETVEETSKNTELIKKTSRLLKNERLTDKQKDAYRLHSRKLTKYKRLSINVYKRNAQWSIDLADLNNIANFNNQYRYLLVCVDIYSRYAFVRPLKTKTARNVANKFEDILIKEKEIPLKIQSDEGTEFTLIKRDLCKKYGFTLFHTYNRETKAVHAERFIETLKQSIQRSLTGLNQGHRYIENLQVIVERYNEAPHRGIYNMTPVDVYKRGKKPDAVKRLKSILNDNPKPVRLLKQGQHVRIARIKNNIFEKSSLRRWVKEIFRIKKVYISDPVTYSLEDLKGEEITGIFYRSELQTI
ncbi:uncharacterized transposon-derived [Paramuricea clavata]|uniref:Uncharacterized transposon-derived n=1 Tax=Paramuricea clavata TaxID=317549 RepID=A0A7D9D618_PARCT|nr:uncharacterized transposon-derived [Paramuricea clavata]